MVEFFYGCSDRQPFTVLVLFDNAFTHELEKNDLPKNLLFQITVQNSETLYFEPYVQHLRLSSILSKRETQTLKQNCRMNAAITNLLKTTKGFNKVLDKVKVISFGDGNLVAELKVDEEHTNPMGGLHGGLSATLVDVLSSTALCSHPKVLYPRPHVSVDIHMTYLKGAKVGDEIVIDSRTVRAGNTLAFLEVEIKNKKTGDVLVRGSHTKYIMPLPEKKK